MKGRLAKDNIAYASRKRVPRQGFIATSKMLDVPLKNDDLGFLRRNTLERRQASLTSDAFRDKLKMVYCIGPTGTAGCEMPFPQVDRVVYEVNPLDEVVCQLRFPKSFRLESQPPVELQERMRKTFPLYRATRRFGSEWGSRPISVS